MAGQGWKSKGASMTRIEKERKHAALTGVLDFVTTPVRAPLGGVALAGTNAVKAYQGIVKNRRNIVVKAAGFATAVLVVVGLVVPKVFQSAIKSNEEVITEIQDDIEEIKDNVDGEGDGNMYDRPGATID